MSALASLAAYGDDDDDEPVVEASKAAQAEAPASSSPAGSSALVTNGAHPASASLNTPPPEASDAVPPAPGRSLSGPSSPIAPTRTPPSLTSSIAHLLPPPPLPHATSNPAIEAKIQNFFGALQRGHSVSTQLRSSKRFNNPDILEKLVLFFELDEIGSNYDPQVFDPRAPVMHTEDYKALAERQANGGVTPGASKTVVDFVPAAPKPQEGGEAKPSAPAAAVASGSSLAGDKTKRSKWDIPAEEGAPPPKVAKPAAPAPAPKQSMQEKSAYRQFLEKRKTDGK